MTLIKLFFYVSVLFFVDATVNVCIPLQSSDVIATNPFDLFKGIKNEIATKLTVNTSEPNLYLDHIDVDINHPAIRLLGTLDNVSVYHLLNFNVCFLENIFMNDNSFKFDVFNITFTNVRLEGIYNLTGDLGDIFDIYGDGNFWLELKNLSLSLTDFTLNVTDEICFPINLGLDLQEIENHFYNFMYDDELEELFNDVIAAIVPESIRIVWQEIKEIFDKPLEDAINDILHNKNVGSILNILKNVETTRVLSNGSPYCFTNNDNNSSDVVR